MNDPAPNLTLSIAAVERDTGLTKDTLRVWERRYGFPQPSRDAIGDRAYPLDQVERLRLIKRLLDAGHRPGRIVALDVGTLERLIGTLMPAASAQAVSVPVDADLSRAYLETLRRHDVPALSDRMRDDVARLGIERFLTEVLAPLNAAVGDAWLQGRLEIFEEHVYTEVAQGVLRQAITLLPTARATMRPRVLLGTLPGEPHGLGLLMAQAMLGLHGAACVSLGVQTPVWDMVRAAEAYGSDIVALGFTGAVSPTAVVDGLRELRAKLSPAVQVWAGGAAPVLQRRRLDGVQPLTELDQIPAAVAAWRAEAQAPRC